MNLAFCRLLTFALGWILSATCATAASTSPPPVIRTYVLDVITTGLVDQQVFLVPSAPARPMAFGATIARESGSLPMDVYLGVIVPGGRILTWVPKEGGGALLVEGLSPVARAVSQTAFATSDVFGSDARYTFAEGDAPGLYSVFTLLVPPGRDPADARQWHWVNMVPLLFQGLTIQ